MKYIKIDAKTTKPFQRIFVTLFSHEDDALKDFFPVISENFVLV